MNKFDTHESAFLDCGATHFRDAKVKEGLRERAPDLKQQIDGLSFGEITGYVFHTSS